MKSRNLILMMTFLLSSLSSASQISFLKTEEFQKLSQEKKIQYLNGLQKIIVGMSKLSPYMADADQQSDNRQPASSKKSAKDDFDAGNGFMEPPTLTTDPAVQAAIEATAVPASAPAQAPKASAPPPAPTLPAAVATPVTQQKITGVPQPPLEPAKPAAAASQPAPASAPAKPAAAQPAALASSASAPAKPAPAAAAPAPEKAKPEAAKPVTAIAPTPGKKPAVASDSQFRCMHSGFVIEKDPCRGFQKIPDWMGIDGLSENNKSCGPGLTVCNPVIFGLKLSNGCNSFLQEGCSQKAKPFCAQGTLWPTEECQKMATDNQNRGTKVAAEIRSDVKPQLFERFEQQFNSLCNPENIKKNPHAEMKNGKPRSDKSAQAVRDDITKTCEWAQKQTNLLNESFTELTASKNRDALNRSEKGSK